MDEPQKKETEEGKKEADSETSSEDDGSEDEKVELTSVHDYGVAADQNWKYRRRMEDAHYMEDGFNNDPHQGFFAVYDGHGGKEAAAFAANTLHLVLAENLNKDKDVVKDPAKMQELLKKVYAETDEKMKDKVPSHHGCTSVTCFLTKVGEEKHLFTANAGDARAMLIRDGKAIRLTEEHKATDEPEAKRIQDLGGFIINGRVNGSHQGSFHLPTPLFFFFVSLYILIDTFGGQIVITRSLGDHIMKEFIICDPYTSHYQLSDKDTHLIIACDGLWDVCEDQAAADFVLSYPDAKCEELSKRLLVKALKDGSTDNLSVCVVKL